MTRVAKPGLPDVKIEIAPTATPFTASPTWVDVTTDLRLADSVTASRGRTDARSHAQPGTLSLTLNNPSGNYTPGLASGTYHPLKLRCPIRLSFKPPGAGAYTVMWTGLIDEYAPGWVSSRPIVTLQCSDRLSALNRVEVPQWEASTVLAKSPLVLFPLTEDANATTVGSIAGTPHSMTATETGTGGSYDLGAGSLPVDEGTVCAFTPTGTNGTHDGWLFKSSTNGTGAAGGTSGTNRAIVSCLMNASAAPWAHSAMFAAGVNNNDGTITMSAGALGIGLSTVGTAFAFQEQEAAVVTLGVTRIDDGAWHHVAAYGRRSGGDLVVDLYVDGVLDATGSVGFGSLFDRFDGYYIGGTPLLNSSSSGTLFSGQLAMCAAWYGSAADIDPAAIIAAGNASLAGSTDETTTDRFTRLCTYAGITGATVGTGASTVGRQKIRNQSVLDALDDVATAEVSPIYVTGAGVPTLAARTQRYGAAVALTIDAKDVGADVKFTYNGDGLINDAKGTRLGGAEQRVTNTTSIADHGAATYSETFILNSDAQIAGVLQWLTNVYGEPRTRAATLRIDGWVKQATVDLDDLLALEVGSRLQVTNMPAQAPSSTLDLFAEGFTDVFNTNGWVRTVNTSGAEPYVNVWVLDSLTNSQLDSTTILAL